MTALGTEQVDHTRYDLLERSVLGGPGQRWATLAKYRIFGPTMDEPIVWAPLVAMSKGAHSSFLINPCNTFYRPIFYHLALQLANAHSRDKLADARLK